MSSANIESMSPPPRHRRCHCRLLRSGRCGVDVSTMSISVAVGGVASETRKRRPTAPNQLSRP